MVSENLVAGPHEVKWSGGGRAIVKLDADLRISV